MGNHLSCGPHGGWSTMGVPQSLPEQTLCKFTDLIEISVLVFWRPVWPPCPFLLISQGAGPQHLHVIILGGWAGGPDAQCVTRVLSSTSGPGVAEFLGPGLPFLGLPWEKMPLLLEGGGCGGEG